MKLRRQQLISSSSLIQNYFASRQPQRIICDTDLLSSYRFYPHNPTRTFHATSNDSTSSRVNEITAAASNYLSTLRVKAASLLAESLPATKREHLLKSLKAIDADHATANTRKSVGEAIVQALEKESKRTDELWEERLKEIQEKAEQAALDRYMTEIKIEAERVEERDEASHHPLLGAPLVDLGYKSVYLTSVAQLKTIPVWERQRAYRHERAEFMANDKLKRKDTGLPGIIALHEAPNGQLSVLDGQHRVGMMTILHGKNLDKSETGIDLDNVLVEVFSERQDGTISNKASQKLTKSTLAKQLFTEINKAEPIKLVDMPGIAKSSDRKLIDDAASLLEESFRGMFKPSQRCRAPHMNIDNLRDALFTSDILRRYSFQNEKELVDWILEKNLELSEKYTTNEVDQHPKGNVKGKGKKGFGFSKSVLEKARKNNFYLGLDSTWLYK